MKVDIIKKFKWYVVGFILVAIMLSVSLSFCSWDTLSVKAKMTASKSGSFEVWSNYIKDANGNKITTVPTIGQVVTFGRFYQSTDALHTNATEPQKWIVVDYDASTKVATLLSEKVVMYGNFWGAYLKYNQNYYQSTVRSWLNSGKGSLNKTGVHWTDNDRYDDNKRSDEFGSVFGINESQQNKGFLDVAFSENEKTILVPKTISGIYGNKNNKAEVFEFESVNGRNYINDLVWLPSYQEIYGTKENFTGGMTLYDGTPNKHFAYFDDVIASADTSPKQNYSTVKGIAGATDYSRRARETSYANTGGGAANGTINASWWLLRSPDYTNNGFIFVVNTNGSAAVVGTDDIYNGVRPAVCVQL